MIIRPLEATDAPRLHALLTRPDVAPAAGTTPYDPPALTAERLQPAGGGSVHRFGAFVGEDLLGYVALTPSRYARAHHVARLTLVTTGGSGAALLAAVTDLAWKWLGLDRLEVEVSAAAGETLDALEAAGFVQEFRKVAHRREHGVLIDALGWAIFRPGWRRPAPTGQAPPWPPRAASPAQLHLRVATAADAVGWADHLRRPEVRWGTLQVPSVTADLYRDRFAEKKDRGVGFVLAAEIDGELIGSAGVHPFPFPSVDVAGIGMGVSGAWQGRGVGKALLRALIDGASWLGVRRLELEVYPDNHRAVALYRTHGFVTEGVRVAAAWREGDMVDSRVLGRVG